MKHDDLVVESCSGWVRKWCRMKNVPEMFQLLWCPIEDDEKNMKTETQIEIPGSDAIFNLAGADARGIMAEIEEARRRRDADAARERMERAQMELF